MQKSTKKHVNDCIYYIYAACWCHDTLEDIGGITYNDLFEATNKTTADIAYALTNEKGKNRSERANDKYYEGIRETPNATFVKLCDRLANIYYSHKTNSSMLYKYRNEHEGFKKQLWDDKYADMFQEMEFLLNNKYGVKLK